VLDKLNDEESMIPFSDLENTIEKKKGIHVCSVIIFSLPFCPFMSFWHAKAYLRLERDGMRPKEVPVVPESN